MNAIKNMRNDSTGELSPPHRIGKDDSGRDLYQGLPGWTPVDADSEPVEVEYDGDGNFTLAN